MDIICRAILEGGQWTTCQRVLSLIDCMGSTCGKDRPEARRDARKVLSRHQGDKFGRREIEAFLAADDPYVHFSNTELHFMIKVVTGVVALLPVAADFSGHSVAEQPWVPPGSEFASGMVAGSTARARCTTFLPRGIRSAPWRARGLLVKARRRRTGAREPEMDPRGRPGHKPRSSWRRSGWLASSEVRK